MLVGWDVAGNAPQLRYGKLGKEIDSHDVVIRFNDAPVKWVTQHAAGLSYSVPFIDDCGRCGCVDVWTVPSSWCRVSGRVSGDQDYLPHRQPTSQELQ